MLPVTFLVHLQDATAVTSALARCLLEGLPLIITGVNPKEMVCSYREVLTCRKSLHKPSPPVKIQVKNCVRECIVMCMCGCVYD